MTRSNASGVSRNFPERVPRVRSASLCIRCEPGISRSRRPALPHRPPGGFARHFRRGTLFSQWKDSAAAVPERDGVLLSEAKLSCPRRLCESKAGKRGGKLRPLAHHAGWFERRCLSAVSSCRALNGFLRKASAPAAVASARCVSWLRPVMATTRTDGLHARMARIVVVPS